MASNYKYPEELLNHIYPKEQKVQRLNIICSTDTSSNDILRIICSKKKMNILVDLRNKKIPIVVTYGKYSKIIYKWSGTTGAKKDYTIERMNAMF